MGFIKFICASCVFILAGWVGSKGFHMPNSAAANMCFGFGLFIAVIGFGLLSSSL